MEQILTAERCCQIFSLPAVECSDFIFVNRRLPPMCLSLGIELALDDDVRITASASLSFSGLLQ